MKQKISYGKWKSVMDFFAKTFKEPSKLDSLPDKVLILHLSRKSSSFKYFK